MSTLILLFSPFFSFLLLFSSLFSFLLFAFLLSSSALFHSLLLIHDVSSHISSLLLYLFCSPIRSLSVPPSFPPSITSYLTPLIRFKLNCWSPLKTTTNSVVEKGRGGVVENRTRININQRWSTMVNDL